MKIGLAQINPTIADVKGNINLIIKQLKKAKTHKIDILAFPEMSLLGYPAKDLLLNKDLIKANQKALKTISSHTQDYKAVIIGYCKFSEKTNTNLKNQELQHLNNSYALLQHGKVKHIGNKICLPNYNIFDEYRYFIPGKEIKTFQINNFKIGILICEDIWNTKINHPIYPFNPMEKLKQKQPNLIITINASPYELKKDQARKKLVCSQAKKYKIPIAYVNMWGANDEIVFDGGSFFVNPQGKVIKQAKFFQEDLLITDLKDLLPNNYNHKKIKIQEEEKIYQALIIGKREYHKKNKIKKSVIGISGGIDSALSLAIDVKAISNKNVLGIISPSQFSSQETLKDAIKLCQNFKVKYKIIPIAKYNSKNNLTGITISKYNFLKKYLGQKANKEITLENQQAIERMSILRYIANEENRIITGTGNKSELAVGYSTICGDLNADILPIADLYKTQIYSLANYINKLYKKEIIPKTIIKRQPSAELNKNQVDPFNYQRLDIFLKLYIEKYLSHKEILKNKIPNNKPFTKKEINHWIMLINKNEHKRKKSALIIKINKVSFGIEWKMNQSINISQ